MKKNLLVLLALTLMAWVLLPGCSTDAEKAPAAQVPETQAAQPTAADTKIPVAAMPADSVAQPGTDAKAKKAGKDSDDDDDDDDDRK